MEQTEAQKKIVEIQNWFDNGNFTREDVGIKLMEMAQWAEEQAFEKVRRQMGFMRQWLNEDRIADSRNMVTTEELLKWIELPEITLEE